MTGQNRSYESMVAAPVGTNFEYRETGISRMNGAVGGQINAYVTLGGGPMVPHM